VDPGQLDQLLHPVLDPKSKQSLALLAKGLPASPGASVGTIVFTADHAVERAKTSPVVLVRKETVPDDIHGMEVAKGILTSRGGIGVRANADIPRDAQAARKFGAEGIGLCRTEHMFFAEDRIEHMQAMILARDEKSRRKALLKLLPMQRADFAGLFKAMDGFPVVIRTLDPPLHEFLPKREDLMVDIAILPYADIKKKRELVARYQKFGAEV